MKTGLKLVLTASLLAWVWALFAYATAGYAAGPALDRETATRRLRGAAIEGWTKMAREAIRFGAEVDETDEYGTTPLLLASLRGHDRVVDALLAAGADPNRENDDRLSPLFVAAANCNDPVVTALLRKGANPNARNRTRQSALMRAAENGCAVVVKELLKARGIDLRATDDSGRTALEYANDSRVLGLDGGDSFALLDDFRRAEKKVVPKRPTSIRRPVALPRVTPRNLPRGTASARSLPAPERLDALERRPLD